MLQYASKTIVRNATDPGHANANPPPFVCVEQLFPSNQHTHVQWPSKFLETIKISFHFPCGFGLGACR